MRIGLVVPGFSANAADWCIPALRHLARQLAGDDDVRVVALRYPYRAGRYRIEGADVLALGGAARRGVGVLEVWRRAVSALAAEHRRQPFDVLHAFWATESGMLAAIAGRLLRVPTLVSLAGGELVALPAIAYGDQRLAWERCKVRTSLRLASAVTAGSDYVRHIAERHVQHGRLYRAPLGVPLDLFRPGTPGRTIDDAAVVHVGTLTPVKDQATLLRAFAVARARLGRGSLDIVGAGPVRGELAQLAHTLDVAPSVRFLGEVDHAALPEVYRRSNVFVLSSLHEAQGMVAIEAALCGLAVVGTRVGVVPELTDCVAPVSDAEGLADALTEALARPTGQAHDRAETEFGLATCTQRFRDLYAAVMSGT